MMTGTVTHVCLNRGGVPKLPVEEAYAGPLGLVGDVQRNRKYHGGPRQALLLQSAEDLDQLRAEGFPVGPGSLGENLTVAGLDFRLLQAGQRFRVGGVLIELTKPRTPCAQLEIYNGGTTGLIQAAIRRLAARGGFYAAVLEPGPLRPGDAMASVDSAGPATEQPSEPAR